MCLKILIIITVCYKIFSNVQRNLLISLTEAICRVVMTSFKEVKISTKKPPMVVEPSSRKTGVLVCSSATESGGDMEDNVDKDAKDDDWEDHDEPL